MKKAKSIFTLTAVVLACLLILPGVLTLNASTAKAQLPEFNIADSSDPARGSSYPDSSVRVIPAAQAPAGADGNVIELFGTEGAGVLMDYSAYDISCYGIRSITVKVYIPGDVKAVNLTVDNGQKHVGRYSAAGYEKNKWSEFSFYDEGINFISGYDMPDLANEKGRLGQFSLNFTRNIPAAPEGSEPPAPEPIYIDSISIELKEGIAGDPALTYKGPDTIDQTADKPLELGEFEAYDAFEERELTVTQRWDGANGVDGDGNAIEGGPYTLVLEAENSFGNKAEKRITVNVRPRDNEAPVIAASTDVIYVHTGTYGSMNIFATDNEDDVEVVNIWSKGAIDDKGRLLPGEHELTLRSADDTGNVTEHVIKVIAADSPEHDPEQLPVTRDESKINFGLPAWAVILIIVAALILCAALFIIIVRSKKIVEAKSTSAEEKS